MDTVVVSGAIANKLLNGGEAWVRLSWILGLRRLGLDVWFVWWMYKRFPAFSRWMTAQEWAKALKKSGDA